MNEAARKYVNGLLELLYGVFMIAISGGNLMPIMDIQIFGNMVCIFSGLCMFIIGAITWLSIQENDIAETSVEFELIS